MNAESHVTGTLASAVREKMRAISPLYISGSVLLVISVGFGIANPALFSLYNIGTILDSAVILLAVGLGESVVILTGGLDLSVGSTMSLVSVVVMLFVSELGYAIYPVALGIGVVAGLINGILVGYVRVPSFVASLGMNGMLLSTAYLFSKRSLAAPADSYGILQLINGAVFGIQNRWIIGAALLFAFAVILRFTVLGRHVFYVGSNERMSWLSGVNVRRVKVFAFTISGFAAALAGVLLSGKLFSGYPTIGSTYVLFAIAVVAIGGTALTGGSGGPINTLVGALILSVIQNGMTVSGINVYMQQAVLGAMIIVAVALSFDRQKVKIIK